ncbi:hypothetical protein VQ056_13945 [Paenibacillus sp. JTLBN-2024]
MFLAERKPLVEGAEIVAEKALAAFDEGGWLHGLAILFCIIEEMIELLQSADDSDGESWIVIETLSGIDLSSWFRIAIIPGGRTHEDFPSVVGGDTSTLL